MTIGLECFFYIIPSGHNMNCKKSPTVCVCAKTYLHNSFSFVTLMCDHTILWERNFEAEGVGQNIGPGFCSDVKTKNGVSY